VRKYGFGVTLTLYYFSRFTDIGLTLLRRFGGEWLRVCWKATVTPVLRYTNHIDSVKLKNKNRFHNVKIVISSSIFSICRKLIILWKLSIKHLVDAANACISLNCSCTFRTKEHPHYFLIRPTVTRQLYVFRRQSYKEVMRMFFSSKCTGAVKTHTRISRINLNV
jgi:hypothetical protein